MVKIKIDVTPWRRRFKQAAVAVTEAGAVIVVGDGEAAQTKLAASHGRGDKLELSPEAMGDCKTILARGIKVVMEGAETTLRPAMVGLGVRLVQDAREGILDARVAGPNRSDEWIMEKQNNVNDYGDGKWDGHMADNLDFELVSR